MYDVCHFEWHLKMSSECIELQIERIWFNCELNGNDNSIRLHKQNNGKLHCRRMEESDESEMNGSDNKNHRLHIINMQMSRRGYAIIAVGWVHIVILLSTSPARFTLFHIPLFCWLGLGLGAWCACCGCADVFNLIYNWVYCLAGGAKKT